MEGDERPGSTDLTLLSVLSVNPQKVHIFQALRIIEAGHAAAPRLGKSSRPRQDAVRFEQEAEPAFPTSTIVSYDPPNGARPGRIVNRFFGPFGANGPLPLHLTEYARDRARNNHDGTFAAFS